MDPRTQERVEQWDSRPFSGGYDGLSNLADDDFSGAVTDTGTWLFMLNGRVVGVVDGTIEDFETASGTVYEAPDPALPLLCTMESQGGEPRAKYYTNETPLQEVDQTLQDGSFTGYIELSENVLSGDYYAVYYGGRRMAAAYIGNAERLLTGEEAFERAADEVGIYEVTDVEIDVTDVPGTDTDESATDSGSDTVDDGSDADSVANASSRAEPSADPTESAIDAVDISSAEPTAQTDTTDTDDGATGTSIGDVTIGEPADGTTADSSDDPVGGSTTDPTDVDTDVTDGPSGITTTDDTEPDPPSSGITDADVPASASETTVGESSPSDASPAIDGEPDAAGNERTTAPARGTSTASESVPTAAELAEQPEPDSSETTVETAERSTPSSAVSESTEDDVDDQQGTAEIAGDTGPSPAEVEAAAQQLEESDISWTEDDVDAPDEAPTVEPTETASTAETDVEPAPAAGTEERFEEEAQWRETRSIPSIDPDNSEVPGSSQAGAESHDEASQRTQTGRSDVRTDRADSETRERPARRREASTEHRETHSRTRAGATQETEAEPSPESDREAEPATTGDATASDERTAALTQRIETLEAKRDELARMAEELEAERDRLRSENEELSATVDQLRSRIEDLEAELERARETADDEPAARTELPPERALAETNLFVRYASKSQPTLESAHDGEGDREAVATNLRLERHTGFDATDVAVDGRDYESFLTETIEHRFVDWLTGTALFEIRETGNADGLGDLYDAIPRIDRVELDATISLADDDTEDVPDRAEFDVVAFDKMGNPLVVANFNDSRDPATREMLETVEETASAVKANYPDLAAAVVVTASYFEPGALEVAEQATSSGLLSRGSKLSYVNLSRKRGYHLCLVESRSEGFHVNVPEL